jgi:hypothetical protein
MKTTIALIVLCGCFSSPANMPLLEGTIFDPGQVPIEWSAKIERTNLWVYKVVPQTFSPAVISNAMTVGSFRGTDIVGSQDTNRLRFQKPKTRPTQHLEIRPRSGWMKYRDDTGTSDMVGPVTGVPDFPTVERLGMELLLQLGIDRTQIAVTPRSKTDVKRSRITPTGEETDTEVQARGMMFPRSIDGIHFLGLGSRGGLFVQFGNNEKIINFELAWPSLIPSQLCPTASPDQIITFVRSGKAVHASDANLSQAKKFTIKALTPCYLGPFETETQTFVYPLFVSASYPVDSAP